MSEAAQPGSSGLDVVREWFAAGKAGESARRRELASVDLEWTVVGRTDPVARRYVGQEEFFGDLVGTLKEVFVPGSISFEILGMWEDRVQSTVVTHLNETAIAQAGGSLFENQIVTIMTIDSGQIVRCLEFMDLYEFVRATSA